MTGRLWTALRASAALAALGLAGCIHVGDEFPVKPVAGITVGETTHEEIARRFGKPWRTGYESGQRTWTYGDYRWSLFGGSNARDLVVRFDSQGRVTSYTFNSTWPEDTRAR